MNRQPKAEKIDRDNPEWTERDFARAVPFEALPEGLRRKLGGRGPLQKPRRQHRKSRP